MKEYPIEMKMYFDHVLRKKLPAALSRFDSSSDALPGASDGEDLVFFQRKERNGDLDLERTLRRDSLLAGVGAKQTNRNAHSSEHYQ